MSSPSISFSGHKLTFQERRRFRLWGMAETVPVKARDVYERAPKGLLEVSGPQFDEPMPVRSAEDLAELAFFVTGRGTVADLPTAQALSSLEELGWEFSQGETRIGAYGAYNRLGEDDLLATRGPLQIPLGDSQELQHWSETSRRSAVAASAGMLAYEATKGLETQDAVARLATQGRFAEAAQLLPDEPWAEKLSPRVHTLMSLALEEHPGELGKVAGQLYLDELSEREKNQVGEALLTLAPKDEPVAKLMRAAWRSVSRSDCRAIMAEEIWPHLGQDDAELRAAGLRTCKIMGSTGSMFVQRAALGQLVCDQLPNPSWNWIKPLVNSVSSHESKTALCEASLDDNLEDKAEVYAQALSRIDYNKDGAKVGRAALEQVEGVSVELAREFINERTYATQVQVWAGAAMSTAGKEGDQGVLAFAREGLRAMVESDHRDYHDELGFSRRLASKLKHTNLGRLAVGLASLQPDNYSFPALMMKRVFDKPLSQRVDDDLLQELAPFFPKAGRVSEAARALAETSPQVMEWLEKQTEPIEDLTTLAAAFTFLSEKEEDIGEVQMAEDLVRINDMELARS